MNINTTKNNVFINRYLNHIQMYSHVNNSLGLRINIMTDYDNVSEFSITVDGSDADDFCLEHLNHNDLAVLAETFTSIGKEIDKFINKDLYTEDEYHG